MRLGGLLTMTILAYVLFRFWKQDLLRQESLRQLAHQKSL
jgi:hypothetical protein